MYQPSKNLTQEENKPAKGRNAGAGKALAMAGGRPIAAIARNRKPLGDISNLVSSLPNQATIRNDLQQENVQKQGPLLNRPITRRFGATLAYRQQVAKAVTVPLCSTQDPEKKAEIETTWGVKAKQTVKSSRPPPGTRVLENRAGLAVVDKPDAFGADAKVSALIKGIYSKTEGGGIGARRSRDKRTLTALLTARSEAALGGFLVEELNPEETVVNIDAKDVGDQLAVVDYVEDIYSFYRNTEVVSCVPSNYMSSQTDINEGMRAILIDWLIEVHYKFKLMPETLFLAINVMDRFLAIQKISRKNLQLVGVTALLIAAKYEEICFPVIEDLVFISDNAFTREDVLELETKMLNKLRFNLTVPTPYVFIMRFLKAASADEQLGHLAFFLAELCLTEYIMLKFRPSLLAAAAVYTAKCTLQKFPLWDRILQFHSGYSEAQLKVGASLMVAFHRNAKAGSKKAVFEKYSSPGFNAVATIKPASLVTLSC